MVCSFFIEAKSFCFTAKDGFPDFRLEEKRKGYVGAILVSPPASNWLVDSLEEACLIPVKVDFAKSYREEGKALMVHRGGNKVGRFLQVGIYVEGGRKGVICILEGQSGNGWRQFVNELRRFLSSKEKGLDLEVSRIPHVVACVLGGRLRM
jgi:hypothetical protein